MNKTKFDIRLPKNSQYSRADEEYFFLTENGNERKIMLQDYIELYKIPRFYEYFAFEYLKYQSPQVLSTLLIDEIKKDKQSVAELEVLEIGSGSGLMAKELKSLGIQSIIGTDILPQAAEAALRDYPAVYDNYYVEDWIQLSKKTADILKRKTFNCLVCCSALSHIPISAFKNAYNMIGKDGWIVFNISKLAWEDKSAAGFINNHSWVNNPELFELKSQYTYLHRNRTNGDPIDYIAFIGIKRGACYEEKVK